MEEHFVCNCVNLVSGGQIVSWSAAVCLANTIMIFICQNFSYYCQILLSKSLFGGNIYSTIKYKCSGNNFNLTFIKDNQRRRTHLLGSRQKKKLLYLFCRTFWLLFLCPLLLVMFFIRKQEQYITCLKKKM